MKQWIKLAAAAAIGAATVGSIVYAQAQAPAPAPRSMVTIYHAAPGQQVALLHWLADQDRASQAAGLPTGQLYVHLDGDSWDYIGISPATTPAQDAAVEAAAAKLGLKAGPQRALQFRTMIISHTDTMTMGPTTAAAVLAHIGG